MKDTLSKAAVIIHDDDNVMTAVRQLGKGTELSGARASVILQTDIDAGHKFAIREIRKNESIIKYGQRIGIALADIKPGEWVHVHNTGGVRGRGDLKTEGGSLHESEAAR